MYKRNVRKLVPKPSGNVPLPVVLSQKPLETPINHQDKENDEAVPSSQHIEEQIILASQPSSLTQSRFLSQRQVSRFTQDAHDRGKNYFEIALLSCKIKITDHSKF